MTIWMVVGLHKERWESNTLRNYKRQTYPDKNLVVVLNGEYDGRSAGTLMEEAWSILRSGPDPAKVMNVALSHIRLQADPNDWFCKCDADDYYGPRYLEHVAEHAEADYSGLKSVYVKSQDNRLWYAAGNESTTIVHGPTIAGKVSTALPFKEGLDWGEDTVWCHEMQKAGHGHSIRPSDGFCYQRWADYKHTWPCSDEELLAAWPIPMYEIGEFDEDVVDGLKPHKYSKVLEQQQLSMENSMPVRILLERTKGAGV